MKNIEIERKFLIHKSDLPKKIKNYKHDNIIQGFLNLKPCIRVRKIGKKYFFTIKTLANKKLVNKAKSNDMVRMEYEIPIDKKTFNKLIKLCSGRIIDKDRYYIPYKNNVIELDIFNNSFKGLIYAEVEFNNLNNANNFVPPSWFYKEVTGIDKYKNNMLSCCKNIKSLLKY